MRRLLCISAAASLIMRLARLRRLFSVLRGYAARARRFSLAIKLLQAAGKGDPANALENQVNGD